MENEPGRPGDSLPREHFRSIFEGLPALVTLMTPAGDLELVNARVMEYFGKSLEELKAWGRGASFHPDDYPAVLAAWGASIDTGEPCEFEARQRRADGVYRWVHTRGHPLRDSDGRILRWYFLQVDVDDTRRASALLAGEKSLLELVANGHPMAEILDALCKLIESAIGDCYCSVVLLDPAGTRLEQGAAPSLPPSFIGSIVGRQFSVDSGPCGMAVTLKGQVVSGDLESERRWAEYWCPMARKHGLQACWSTPIPSASGKMLGAFAIYYEEPRQPGSMDQGLIARFTSIASIAVERTRTEAALKRSEALLTEAQHLSSTGSFWWRVPTGEISYSDQTNRIYGFEPGVPMTLELIAPRIHPEDVPLLHEMIAEGQGRGNDLDYHYRLLMPDGSVKYLHLVAHATRDSDGGLEYIGAIQDVTQRRLSEEALSKVRSELAHVARVNSLGALTASIAHEVNQPLSGIITNASTCLRMLAADPPNIEGALETARRTIRDGNRAADVIAHLRALFAKKEAVLERLDLNEAAREVVALTSTDFQRNGIALRTELADDLPPVMGDRVQLQQVILNLLLNACDAMSGVDDRSRQVVIRTSREEGDRVCLAVRDAGMGFGEQGAERLFEPFYTTKAEGMGIGLSVSRSIIESHHGRLWAAANEGPGATFAFSIPRGPEHAKEADGLRLVPAVARARTVRNP